MTKSLRRADDDVIHQKVGRPSAMSSIMVSRLLSIVPVPANITLYGSGMNNTPGNWVVALLYDASPPDTVDHPPVVRVVVRFSFVCGWTGREFFFSFYDYYASWCMSIWMCRPFTLIGWIIDGNVRWNDVRAIAVRLRTERIWPENAITHRHVDRSGS